MRLSVATNFEDDLIDAVRRHPVIELYGKLRQDTAGGGRAPYQLAPVTRKRLREHVKHARAAGLDFNYLLNASCMSNREITRKGQKRLERLIDWICGIGISWVTVASPYMLRLVKARYPGLKVRISVFGGVDRVRKAQMWEDLGADCIVLDSILVNRELETLAQIRRHVRCELELLANNNCLLSCALSPMHMNALSHTAQSWHANRGFFIDWCLMKCTEMKMRDPLNYIRSEWIRPEDLHVYEELGYDRFKIVERDIPTPVMLRRVEAYSARRYDGNLLDLIQPFGFGGVDTDGRYYRRGIRWYARFLLRPTLVNPCRMVLLKRVIDARAMLRPVQGDPPVYVDNRALDGFIERFKKKGCNGIDCDECGWCREYAQRAVKVDAGARLRALKAYDDLFASLDGGSMWRYGRRHRQARGEPPAVDARPRPAGTRPREAGGSSPA